MPQRIVSLLILTILPNLIFAHGSHGDGVMAGFTHPILGVDHNVAILGSGILGYLLDQKKWYLFPLAFILSMIVGGYLGIGNEATVFIEKVIAFSVFATGIIIALQMRINIILILITLAVFGFFHGYAHGAEMPETNTALKYIFGYTLGAVLLAGIGAFIGKSIYSQKAPNSYIATVGGIVIGCGIMMLLP